MNKDNRSIKQVVHIFIYHAEKCIQSFKFDVEKISDNTFGI